MTTGVILAGGHSRRFADGDKALARLAGRPLIVHVAETLAASCDALLISCRASQQQPLREALGSHGYDPTVVVDEAVVGPLGGIRDGLHKADTLWSYVVGCDFPGIDTQTLEALDGETDAEAVLFASSGRTQPLCGRYRTEPTAVAADNLLSADCRRVTTLVSELSVEVRPGEHQPFAVDTRLKNVNTRADLDSLSVDGRE
ncbi:molybdenum cofactor guanylyltransferase [Halohasta litorea]|uniref:Probable molybdenum cofactor guanylyltransferase n=1 Tax=Halohasta litorea TaxID=869891 RepID=A0ABD6DCT7_9EURY|nr:molybdenum cofactor guanylyltransferase [Halohasta litorea]